MAEKLLTNFRPDDERKAVIAECMESYDVGDAGAEWPNNVISRRAAVYGSGRVAREGETVRHAVDPAELDLCRRLSAEAAALMEGVDVGMGSESDDPFRAFYVVANADEKPAARIDEALVRRVFGGTIFPPATITVEPLAEAGVWWAEVAADAGGSDGEDDDDEDGDSDDEDEADDDASGATAAWRGLIAWFRENPAFVDRAFVRVGDYEAGQALDEGQMPPGTELVGSVLPRLAVGLTRSGSVAGVFGQVVQT